jgi:hypothetical protein
VQDQNYGNVWVLRVRAPEKFPGYLRLLFATKKTVVSAPPGDIPLAEWIDKQRIEFVGFNRDRAEIVAFVEVPAPPA